MEISENLALMYGRNFKNLSKNVRTAAGMGPYSQNSLFSFGLAIRPQKRFGDNEIANCTEIKSLWHPYRPYYSPRPEYLHAVKDIYVTVSIVK